MAITFNHTIVAANDRRESAGFFTKLFGLPPAREFGLAHWADPHGRQPGQINHHDGGRGVYFPDPSGHQLEIITRPYGAGA
ncbi:VOC family protein [Mycolicibacterium baixiangningiae]|uniref:VOC family protein n=1 Tax=Mycolicibacterium baixiangningiae TaxID=2761578 RepID=UPI0018D0C61D|nr:VOC family protein [Mycolicibacterium baixiangningiae]